MGDNKNVTISEKEYKQLLEKANKFDALRDAGVDNWSGYSEAMKIYHDEYSEKE